MNEIFGDPDQEEDAAKNDIYKDKELMRQKKMQKNVEDTFHAKIPIPDIKLAFMKIKEQVSFLDDKKTMNRTMIPSRLTKRNSLTSGLSSNDTNYDVSEITLLKKGEAILHISRQIESVDLPRFKKDTDDGFV